jgi:hypothetical protein
MATYPTGVASFTTKTDGVTTVAAADPNNIQSEVVAIETYLGLNPHVSKLGGSLPTWNAAPASNAFGSIAARIDNIESGLSTIYAPLSSPTLVTPTITGTATLASQSAQFSNNLQVNESSHATSRRAGATFGSNVASWTIGQDSAGSGTRDFFIYGGTVQNTKLSIAPDGSITVGGTINGTTIPSSKTLLTTTTGTTSVLTSVGTLTGLTMGGDIAMGTNNITGIGSIAAPTLTGTTTLASQSGQFSINLQVNESSHATSRRASTVFGTWVVGQDSAGSGIKDFFIYGGTSAANRMIIGTDGSITVGGTINGTTIPTSKTLVVTTDKLNVHASTTSAELLGVISDETGSGSLVFGTAPTLSSVVLSASAGTNPPLKLTAGTSIPSGGSVNGALEYDGTVAYFHPNDTINGAALLVSTFYWVNSASRTLSTASPASTVAQWIYGGATTADNRGLALGGSTTYEFELVGNLLLTTTSAMDVTLKLTYSGTYSLMAIHAIHGTNQSTPNFTWLQATSGDISLTLGSVNTTTGRLNFTVKGIIRVTSGGGLFAPKVLLSQNNVAGSMSVGAGSYIKMTPLGNESVNALGAWT